MSVELTDRVRSSAFIETCTTSLTINNIPVRLVGVVLALLDDAGLVIEINVSPPASDAGGSNGTS